MADSLGEAFIEVAADSSPFGDELETGIGEALDNIQDDVDSAFDDIPDVAAEAFSEVAGEAEDAASDLSAAFDGAAGEVQESIDAISFDGVREAIENNLGKIALGGAAAGAGLEGFARKERDAQVAARQLARATGMSEREMLDLISATSDATFPLEDVTGLMEIGAQRGLEGADALQEFASFWDMVGDATGENAVALGKAAVALGQVGIGAGDEAEALDALGFIMDNTTIETSKFLRFVGRVGNELGENTPSIDEMAGALGALEDAGLDVRVAQSELQSALRNSDGDLVAALETLGISEDAYRAQVDAVEGSGAAIEGNAAIFAAARTPVERMTQAVREQLFRFPALSEAAAGLAGPLTALGPAAMGFTHGVQAFQMVSGGMTKALGAMRTGFVKLGAVILANPIFLIGALLIGVAVLIWKFRDEIIEALVGAWEWIKDKVGALVDWFRTAIPDAIGAVVDWVKDNWPLILAIITGPIGLAVKFIVDNWDRIKEAVRAAVDAVRNFVRRGFERLRDTVTSVVRRVRDFVVNAFNTLRDRAVQAATNLRDRVVGAVQSLWDGAVERFDGLVNFVRGLPRRILNALGNVGRMLLDAGKGIIQGLWDGMRQIWDNLTGWVGGLGNRIRNLKGPLAADKVLLRDEGQAIIDGLGKGMEDEWDRVSRMLSGMTTSIPMTVEQASADNALSSLAGAGRRGGTNINVTVNNPVPEMASQSVNRELRKLSAIGVFDD